MVSWLFCFLSFKSSVNLTGFHTKDKPKMLRKAGNFTRLVGYHSQKVVNLWALRRPIRFLDSNITARFRPKNQIKYNLTNISYLMTVEIVILYVWLPFPFGLPVKQVSKASQLMTQHPWGCERTSTNKILSSNRLILLSTSKSYFYI